ncbi:EIN3-binding F-box protein 2-like [Rhododendron vialii]|uniref:EIN3-binding F-box protein 2-like n=1 Tax=Rhododendron vialii TaxID=182163 RepID=UPI0026603799|nr:EIN3-binding F-box protein 2-like [Rhododendron vialii]
MAKKGCKDLPDECWELIFNKLHQRHHSLLESLSLSCKRFLSLANALRTHLTVVDPRVFPVSVLLNRFPNLNSIHLSCFRDKDTFNLTLEPLDLQRMTIDVAASDLNLESLSFSGTGLHLESLRMLGSRMKNLKVLMCSQLRTLRDLELVVIADSMPCLEDLDISYPVNDFGWEADEFEARSPGEVGVTDTGIEVLSSKLKSLRKIDVSGNEFLTDYSLITLSTNCIYLTDIVLCDCSFTNHGIEFVMRNSPNLRSLSVQEIEFGEFDEHSLCCARNIANLDIYFSAVPDEFLHLLVKASFPLKSIHLDLSPYLPGFTLSGISSLLNKYRSLECLSLVQTYFLTDEAMSDLSQCLSALVTIRLTFCYNLTESTFFMLAKNCPLLEDITMETANFGGGDRATEIVENPRIKSLNLEYNQNLSDECLAKLASVCPSLEVLDVSCCKGITEKGIADFLKSGSKIRKLHIVECTGIKNVGNGFELSELDFIEAAKSGINDDGLVVIGNRCHGLLNLDLDGCLGVTTVGLKEILTNCERLRKINLSGCLNVCTETVDWMVFSRPSLRKITLPRSYLPSESQRQLFLHHGCLVSSE